LFNTSLKQAKSFTSQLKKLSLLVHRAGNKIIATLLALSLILTLTACGGDTEPSGNNDITTPTTTTAPPPVIDLPNDEDEPQAENLDNSTFSWDGGETVIDIPNQYQEHEITDNEIYGRSSIPNTAKKLQIYY